jgi:membrane protease YdiL (CAAX protease family)
VVQKIFKEDMKHLYWLIPIFYFAMSWFFPWENFQWHSSIAVSYVFDGIFILCLSLAFRLWTPIRPFLHQGLMPRLLMTVGVAFFSLFLINLFGVPAPFRFVESLEFQLLILAPVIEELIFRHVFFGIFDRYFYRTHLLLLSSAVLFSLSHVAALWVLPNEFHGFIYIQLIYTLVLGWICAKSRYQTGNALEAIVLHFVFNLIFYFAVMKGII